MLGLCEFDEVYVACGLCIGWLVYQKHAHSGCVSYL